MSAEPSSKSPELPSEGDLLAGKYRILRLIGQGGMGAVYRARHEGLQHDVAIKLLLPEVAKSADAVARFLNEARAVAKLRSQHVAQVMDVGELENGSAYMALEFLEGTDLASLLEERGPLPVDEAVDFALQALEGVAHAHALGIVHRDLKPANLFLTQVMGGERMIKVLDFGISKATNPGIPSITSVTQTKALLGSPAYMSPEQVRSSKHVDARTDIWSMGVILHRLLTGHPPFDADDLGGIFAAILEETPAPLHTLRPEVPEGLAHVVAKCLERKKENRWQTAAELADALVPFTYPAGSVTAERIRRTLTDAPASRVASLPPTAMASLPTKRAGSMRARAMSSSDEISRRGVSPAAMSVEAPRPAGIGSISVGVRGSLTPGEILGNTVVSGAQPPGARDASTAPWVEVSQNRPSRAKAPLFALAALALVAVGILSVFAFRRGTNDGSRAAAAVGPDRPSAAVATVQPSSPTAFQAGEAFPAASTNPTSASTGSSSPSAVPFVQATTRAGAPAATPAGATTTPPPLPVPPSGTTQSPTAATASAPATPELPQSRF